MNTAELRAALARKGLTNREVSARLNISEQAFYNKVNGNTEFKNSEIKLLAQILGLSMEDVNIIFFGSIVN